MRFKKRKLWLVFVILIYSAGSVTPVLAHAILVRSNPGANAVLEQPRVQVELFFSEALEPQLSSIKVIDANNVSVDAGDVRVDAAVPTALSE